MVKALPFIHHPDRVARKASDVSAADWRYQTRVKNIVCFSRLLLRLSSGLENHCLTPYDDVIYVTEDLVESNTHR